MITAAMRRWLVALALLALLAESAWSPSVEVRPFGKQGGQTVYALAPAGDIEAGDDLRVAGLLGEALVEDRFPGFLMLSSGGGNTEASLGIARIHMITACRFSSGADASAAVRSLH
jgi:hypothetical protein